MVNWRRLLWIMTKMDGWTLSSPDTWNGISRRAYGVAIKRPVNAPTAIPDHFKPTFHLVYHNEGDGTFQDVSEAAGIGTAAGKAWVLQ